MGAITYKCPYALLEEWTKRLGLQDWVIHINDNCKPEDMAVEDSDGCSEWSESIKTARIDILGEAKPTAMYADAFLNDALVWSAEYNTIKDDIDNAPTILEAEES